MGDGAHQEFAVLHECPCRDNATIRPATLGTGVSDQFGDLSRLFFGRSERVFGQGLASGYRGESERAETGPNGLAAIESSDDGMRFWDVVSVAVN